MLLRETRTVSFEKGPFLDAPVRSEALLLFLQYIANKDAQIVLKSLLNIRLLKCIIGQDLHRGKEGRIRLLDQIII